MGTTCRNLKIHGYGKNNGNVTTCNFPEAKVYNNRLKTFLESGNRILIGFFECFGVIKDPEQDK